jgi:uncharacterized protein (TIGR02594 family)
MSDPRWITYAKTLVGTRETAGPKSNSTILSWAAGKAKAFLGIAYTDDATPWCGLFVAECIAAVGLRPISIAVRASSWAAWGLPMKEGAVGAVLVFKRPGGGHVGFYVGEDHTHYHVLGGNQSDAVNVARIEKARCVAIRWPGVDGGNPGKPVFRAANAAANSASEA